MRPLQFLKRLRYWKYRLMSLHPLHFCYRLMTRFCFWLYTPTTREMLRAQFNLGKVFGRKEALKALPITAVHEIVPFVPMPSSPVVPPILGIRERARLRAETGQLFTAPIRRVELLPDDSWLNSDKHTGPFSLADIDTRKVTAEETAKYIALPKFLRE